MSPLALIRELNDAFRRSFATDGAHQILITRGVAALASEDAAAVLLAVREFDAFTRDADSEGCRPRIPI